MDTLKISLKNCYGIKNLEHEFKFTKSHKTFSMYAQNGSMKTSLAKTFENVSRNEPTRDLIFPDRISEAEITFGGNLISQEILVINSYKEGYESEKVSTLLVNKKLQDEFKKIHKTIDECKKEVLTKLKKISGINKLDEIEKEISKTFYNNDDSKIFESFERIEKEVNSDDVVQYAGIKYKDIFDKKVIDFLKNSDVQNNIEEYINKYDELLDKSTYFKKGIFNHSQAEDTAISLTKNGFFKAEHAVLFGENKISTEQELADIIQGEKKQILGDKVLQGIFDKLDKKITKNQNLKNLRDFLSENSFIISELSNLESFKAKLWKYYLSEVKDDFNALIKAYSEGREKIKNIIEQAQKEQTDWLNVIEIFNERFLVPFRVVVSNKVDVILKSDAPSISFEFIEGNEKKSVEQEKLLEVLSQGEKRALYLLNIIFEIEARKKAGGKHIFIIDDIADSFDYKNKYAIIEYLRDISKTADFYQIILSHNFDFHRTISSRLSMKRENKLGILKTEEGVKIEKELYQNDPFNYWRQNLDNDCFLVAAIPFVRNLAEYSGNKDVYNNLTKFLHFKRESDKLNLGELKGLFSEVLKDKTDVAKIADDGKLYRDLLNDALAIKTGNLESKIAKSIAIRLEAERFIIKAINDDDFVGQIESHQTAVLVDKYKEMFHDKKNIIKILDKVQLMTPESIHVNSFMYEPLLDMSNEYLDDLHDQISNLQKGNVTS